MSNEANTGGFAWTPPAPSKYFAGDETMSVIVTDYGANAVAKAAQSGERVDITHVAVGDGGGENYAPDPKQTGLRAEQWRGEICRYEINDFDYTQLLVVARIPADVGTFFVREVGVFDSKGGLVAVGQFPETMKVRDITGAIQTMEIRLYIQFSNAVADQVQIIVRDDGYEAAHEEIHKLARLLKETTWQVSHGMVEELTGVKIESEGGGGCDCGCGCDCGNLSEVTNEAIQHMFTD